MVDALPAHVGDVQQAVDAAEVDERAVVGDVLDHAFEDLAFLQLATSSVRCSARVSSRTARRETTMLPRGRSILRIGNGCGLPISGPTSRTGRMSTWLPGRNATAPPRSTVKPPLTRPKIAPVTRSFVSNAFSRRVQASSRRAFSRLTARLRRACSPSRSRKTSTVSPTLISAALPPAAANSLSATRPSDLQADVDDGEVVLDRDDACP